MKSLQLRDKTTIALRRRKAHLIKNFPQLDGILRGSLIERFLKCGKPNCKCAKGRGHGPKHYLSISHPKSRPEMFYVPNGSCNQVQKSLAAFSQVRETLEEISAINAELIRRREEV